MTDLPRRFQMHRVVDVTGVSGTGTVTDGVLWPDGTVTIRWRGDRPSTVIWDSLDAAMAVHGHDGATTVHWLDSPGMPPTAAWWGSECGWAPPSHEAPATVLLRLLRPCGHAPGRGDDTGRRYPAPYTQWQPSCAADAQDAIDRGRRGDVSPTECPTCGEVGVPAVVQVWRLDQDTSTGGQP